MPSDEMQRLTVALHGLFKKLTKGQKVKLTADRLKEGPEVCVVAIVQTNAVAFLRPNGRLFWLPFPMIHD